MKKTSLLTAVFSLVLFATLTLATSVRAHYLWLTVDKYNPKVGERVKIYIGWGHKFPQDSEPRLEMVNKMNLVIFGPHNKQIPLKLKPKAKRGVEPITMTFQQPGTYIAVLSIRTFVTKTVKGYFYKPKNELTNVVHSYWSEMVAKAIINVGSPTDDVLNSKLPYRYQIIPLMNPARLRPGDLLPVKVILDGKPIRTWLYATYAGFSQYKDTFAWTTRTDKNGVAKIKLLKKGQWLIKAKDSLPYENKEKADEYSFTSTLTFGM